MPLNLITTVIAAAKSYDLTDLATVKDELGFTDGKNDRILKRYISWASAALSQACNRVFVVEAVKDEFWPDRDPYPFQVPGGLDKLQLSGWPIVAVASVTENSVVLVDGTDFRVDYARGQLIRLDESAYPKKWPTWPISVQFDRGFAAVPFDLVDAATRMVKNRWNLKGRDPYLMSESIPGVRDARWWVSTGNEAGNVPPDVADLIDNYRVPVIA